MNFPEEITREKATAEAMNAPRAGDRFTEMYAFWVYVVGATQRSVVVMEAHPPCTLPTDGKIRIFDSLEEFRKAYAYGSIGGYRIKLCDRGNDVRGWFVDEVPA